MKKKLIVIVLALSMVASSSAISFAGTVAKPAKVTLKSATAQSATEVKLSWSKLTKRCSGYQISRDGKIIASIKGSKTVSYTDTDLAGTTTYKYKVRAYRIYKGKKYYGAYSKLKSVKTLTYSTGWPEGVEEGFIPVDGGRVFYHLYGKDKTGIPIIFLHGGPGGSGTCFFKQTALAENHPVVIYNQLGSAGSDFAEGTTLEQAKSMLTIDHFVNEVQDVVDYFGFKEFMIVGRSWGTMLAVEYAAAKQPEGLKGMILDGPFLNVDTWCDDAQRLIKSLPEYDVCGTMMDGNAMWDVVLECEANGKFYQDERYSAINNIYSGNFNSRSENSDANIGTPSDSNVTQYKVSGLSVYNYMWGPSEFSCNGTLKGHDSTVLLKSIKVPLLYVCGEYDSGTFEAAKSYKAKSNKATITVIDGCAHNASRERALEFNAVIEGFARRITK